MRLGGQLDAFVSEPPMHLTYALELREFREAQGILHPPIGIFLAAQRYFVQGVVLTGIKG